MNKIKTNGTIGSNETINIKGQSRWRHLSGALFGILAAGIAHYIESTIPLAGCNCNECGHIYRLCVHYLIGFGLCLFSTIFFGAIGGIFGSYFAEIIGSGEDNLKFVMVVSSIVFGIIFDVLGVLLLSLWFSF